jgi:hypothetical protein
MNVLELGELMLVYLFDKAETHPHSYFFFPLGEFAARVGKENGENLLEAAALLEDEGFALFSRDFTGSLSALMTIGGAAFVERGGRTGIIEKYRSDPMLFVANQDSVLSPAVAGFREGECERSPGTVDGDPASSDRCEMSSSRGTPPTRRLP